MKKSLQIPFLASIFLCSLSGFINAQKKADVQVWPQIIPETIAKACQTKVLGRVLNTPKPDYPLDAKNAAVSGTIIIGIKINEKGSVTEVEKVSGNPLLQGAAVKSALQAKFTPTVCDGAPAPLSGVIAYNFIAYSYPETYLSPSKIEEFTDIGKNSKYYETLIDLLENDKVAFGYADQKFHPDAVLSRGDFAHFLRLTLEMLSNRAKIAGKLPREIDLFKSYNPQKITSAAKITDLSVKQPFAESVKTLLLKYDIVLIDGQGKFNGFEPIKQNEMMDLWTAVFSEDVIPVNFERAGSELQLMTRGEFALFLQESLRVLTYKVLP